MYDLDEVWAYDEPHPCGGNCHITMTKAQAIELTRNIYATRYKDPLPLTDQQLFEEWKAVNWAYKETEKDNAKVE